MSITENILRDIAQITGDANGFGVTLNFVAPNGALATIIGTHTKHHLGVNGDGVTINSKTASIAFSEQLLLAANPAYPLRNTDGEVNLNKHKIMQLLDSTGKLCDYIVKAWFPDEQCGLIVVILNDFINDGNIATVN